MKQSSLEKVISEECESTVFLHTLLNTMVDSVLCIDSNGVVLFFNHSAEESFGFKAEEVLGNNVSMLIPDNYAAHHHKFIRGYEGRSEHNVLGKTREISGKRKDGSTFPVEISIGSMTLNGEKLYTGIIRDISARKEAQEQLTKYQQHLEDLISERTEALTEANIKLEALSKLDGLTEIPNRRYFDEILTYEFQRSRRSQTPLSLLMCDIDYFKAYNDHYGHISGDECLKQIASCFRKTFKRSHDIYARYGGEEFAVILPSTELENARKLASRLLKEVDTLALPHVKSTISDHVTISIGCATLTPKQDDTVLDLLKSADEALYCAKESGRNQVVAHGDPGCKQQHEVA